MESPSKILLLERIRQGDRVALGQLLDELRPYIRVIVRSLRRGQGLSPDNDSDLIQDALLQASQSVGTFQGVTLGEWLGWLRTITVRTTHRTLHSGNKLAFSVPADVDQVTLIAGREADPSADAVRHESAARMALALSRLPDDMQRVLLGRVVDDLDHADLAAQLDRSSGAVRMLYLRAVRRLREIWQTEFSSAMGDST